MTGKFTVAVLGTGLMGAPMAANLAKAGLDVRAWNRSVAKARPLAEHGVTVVEDASEAAFGADIVLTMLADGPAVRAVMDDVQIETTARGTTITLRRQVPS